MNPPAPNSVPRASTDDMDLAGTFVPKGSTLTAEIFVMHHDPSLWKDPEAFIPERFAPGGENESKAGQGLSWTPFGSGSRQCIGKAGSWTWMLTINTSYSFIEKNFCNFVQCRYEL